MPFGQISFSALKWHKKFYVQTIISKVNNEKVDKKATSWFQAVS